jgi:hypothetical protein
MTEHPSVFPGQPPEDARMIPEASKPVVLAAVQAIIVAAGGLLVAFGVKIPENVDIPQAGISAGMLLYSALILWKTLVMDRKTEEAATTTTGLPKPD